MYSQVKRTLHRTSAILLLSMLCATTAQAFTAGHSRDTTEVLTGEVASIPAVQLADIAQMSLPRFSTSLSVAGQQLAAAPLGFGLIMGHPGSTAPAAIGDSHAAELTTASIPSASYSIRQDLPLFGAHRIRFGKIKSGMKISKLIRKAAASDTNIVCVGKCAALAESLTLKGASIDEQFRHISRSVNQMINYKTDSQMHGQLDLWSTPNETLRRGDGDCEDYAILKMALLSRVGVPLNAMEIVVVKDTSRRLFHAVLSVSMNGESHILDNMTDSVEKDVAKWNYAPLFSISGKANYVFGYKTGKPKLVASIGEIMSVAPGAGF